MAYSGRSGSRKPGGNSGNRGRSGGRDSKPSWKKGGSVSGRSGSGSSGEDDRSGFRKKSFGDKPAFSKRSPSDKRREHGDERPAFKKKSFGDKPAFKRRDDGDERPAFKKKSFGDKPAFKRRDDGDERPAFKKKSFGDKPAFKRRDDRDDDRPGFKKKSFGDKPAFKRRDDRDDGRPAFKKKSFGDKPAFKRRDDGDDRPAFKKKYSGGGEARSSRPYVKKGERNERPSSRKSYSDRSEGEWKTFGNQSAGDYVKKKSHRGADDAGDGKIRLNKYIANTGLCSRREADDMIEAGVIKVNGKIVTELGTKIDPTDIVHYGDQPLKREKLVYVLLNKPKDYITTTDDPQERKTVLDLVGGAGDERIYPVGRLDRNTTGVLLLTNDGDLAERLMHPKYGVEKIYQVSLDMNLRKEDFDKILEGIELEDGFIKADDLSFVGDGSDHKEVGIVLHSGRNRIVRRMFEQLGYTVKGLDRVGYAGLTKKNVQKGKWRFLEAKEVGFLKMKVGGEKKRSKF